MYVKAWSVQHVAQWLRDIGEVYAQYVDAFVHEGINGEFKIAELFHVEVYKSVWCCGRCCTIKVAESFFNPL